MNPYCGKEVKEAENVRKHAVRLRIGLVLACLFISFTRFAPLGASVITAQRRPADPAVRDLLASAAAYVAQYESSFGAIVSEERYEQTANARAAGNGPARRVTRSDVLTYYNGAAGWIGLRDVIEVDGRAVGDHADRLLKLVYAPTADGLEDARRTTAESARYNIGAMGRTINVPTIALMFLRLENQTRAEFVSGGQRYGKTPLVILRFKETSADRLIATPDNAAATGLFWIEPKTGRVEHSELSVNSKRYSAKIVVEYADQPKLGLWVPTRMTEEYAVSDAGERVDGVDNAERAIPALVTARADYQNFRKFETKAGLIIK